MTTIREAAKVTTEPRTKTRPMHGTPRKVWLIVHVVSSVGWLGIEACVLALTVLGLTAGDPATLGTAYDAAVLLADTMFLPVTLVMFGSGLVLGLRTKWGLVRYWWVAVKLVVGCALVLAGTYTLESAVRESAELVADGTLTRGDEVSLIGMLAVIGGLALFATVLSVVKPWGRTPWSTR